MDEKERVDEWIGYLGSRGRKESTLTEYRIIIKRVLTKAEELGLPEDPAEVGEAEVFAMLDGLSDLKESTLRNHLTIWGYYLQYSTGHNPVKDADILWNNVEPDRVFITAEDLVRMHDKADPAERLILCLGAFMGLRRAEMCGLRYSDIDHDRLTVRGKGHGPQGKVVTMKIPGVVKTALHEYELYRRRTFSDCEGSDTDILLIHQAGNRFQHEVAPYTLNFMSRTVREVGARVGVKAQTHALRRLFATTLHDSGLDIMDIKTLMRHESVDTTIRCYIRPNQIKLDAVMDSLGFGTS